MKILIPSNLSKTSEVAADFAISYFGEKATYCLLNSFPFNYRSGFYDSFNNYTPEHDEIPLEKLKRERKRLLDKFGTHSIDIKAFYGDPIKDVFYTAEEENVDMIVLGYNNFLKWKDGLKYRDQYSLGDLPYPILIVPENYKHDSTKSICYITDFSNTAISESMLLVRFIARMSKANIKFYCFENEVEDNGLDKWMVNRYLEGLDHSFEVIPNLNGGLKKLEDELRKKVNSIVIFDFKSVNNRTYETIENEVNNNEFIKPLLLMPKGFEENFLRGA